MLSRLSIEFRDRVSVFADEEEARYGFLLNAFTLRTEFLGGCAIAYIYIYAHEKKRGWAREYKIYIRQIIITLWLMAWFSRIWVSALTCSVP